MRIDPHRRGLVPVARRAPRSLAGCTTFSHDGGFGDVQKIAAERLA